MIELLLAFVLQSQAPETGIDYIPVNQEQLWLAASDLPSKGTIVINLTVCHDDTEYCRETEARWQRSQDEKNLMELLAKDFKQLGNNRGQLDKSLRDHIAVLAEKLVKNKYD